MTMVKNFIIFSVLLFFNHSLFAQEIIYGKITKIIDGDTVEFLTETNDLLKVRLIEIDAPELEQKFGNESKNNLTELCEGKEGYLEKTGEDYYGRILARVFCDEINANTHQLITGMAWVYDEYNKTMDNYQYQIKAKKRELGLWSEEFPLPPWDFRKGVKSFDIRIQELEKKMDELINNYNSQLVEYEKIIEELMEKLSNIDKESNSNKGSIFSCSKKSCKDMLSCDEAYFQYQQCGNIGLDHDKNGIPCESICG